MRLRCLGVVGFMGSVSGAESVARFPSLCGKNLVTEALGVVRPGGVLWVVGDLGAAVLLSVFAEALSKT